jgi:hypothetical protein
MSSPWWMLISTSRLPPSANSAVPVPRIAGHLIAALEIEEDDANAGLALQTSLQGAEHHLTTTTFVEADIGRLDQIEIRAIPLVGFGQASLAEHLAASGNRHGVASRSLGRRIRF